MASFVNLTVLVQAVNFFVAYLILKYFLLKPAIAAIRQEDTYQNHLLGMVQSSHSRISDKQQEIEHKWRLCQKEFAKIAPQPLSETIVRSAIVASVNFHDIDSQRLAHRVQEYHTVLLKELEHVRS